MSTLPKLLKPSDAFLQIYLGRLDRNKHILDFYKPFSLQCHIDMLLKKRVPSKYPKSSLLTQEIHNLQHISMQ
jgi:hypothetical protein